MLVYGDPQFTESANAFLDRLRTLRRGIASNSLDDLRKLLIQTGQFEQAVHDCFSSPGCGEFLKRVDKLTDQAGDVFLAAWQRPSGPFELGRWDEALERIGLPADLPLQVKIPEGFEFYALFPEQYCAAALKWADQHRDAGPKRAVVAGIRSIGTTLSAVVAAALRTCGWETLRITLRPTGHPFARQAPSVRMEPDPVRLALVVDEGPGISGSSMAAAACALRAAGIADVTFFPGHGGLPGEMASRETMEVWRQTPRYFEPLEHVRWNGKTLRELFAGRSSAWVTPPDPLKILNLSGGLWRDLVFPPGAAWPAVAAQFERLKFLCCSRTKPAVLWKFSGLGCACGSRSTSAELAYERLAALAELDFVPAPLGIFCGFLATRWIPGAPLSKADVSPALLGHLGNYLARAARTAAGPAEARSARGRLAEVLFSNTKELLGETASDRARQLADAPPDTGSGLPFGDGHVAPHEWIRSLGGRIFKTDSCGHDSDHTVVGRQSLLWDVAGAMTEWNLDSRAANPMFSALEREGINIEPRSLAFYQAAYSAFRAGLMDLGTMQTQDEPEKRRLAAKRNSYREKLLQVLNACSRQD